MKAKTLKIRKNDVGARTDIGRVRTENQDALLSIIAPPDTPSGVAGVFVVADGMGGHKGGAVASRMAVSCVKRIFSDKTDNGDDIGNIGELIQTANEEVYKESFSPELMGMGTTLTVVQINNNGEYHIGHVGDSRFYLIRTGKIQRISTDHSLVGGLVESGQITEEEARSHPQRNVITRAVGLDKAVEPQVDSGLIEQGDILVLCSDGLHGLVSDSHIKNIAYAEDPGKAAVRLIEMANSAGGNDNITVIVVKPETSDLEPTEEKNSKFSGFFRLFASIRYLLKR